MRIEDHYKSLTESVEVLQESIQKGILERQRTIGFNASAAAIDLLEIFLHKKNFIDPGFVIKHEWFNSSRKLEEKFSFEFLRKKEIFWLIQKIEASRTILCYGNPHKEETIHEVLDAFNKLRIIFQEVGTDEK